MSNPFADQASLHSAEDNPFADNHDKYLEPDFDATPNASTVSLPYHQQSQGFNDGTSSGGKPGRSMADDTAARMAEIQRREQELAERERNLGQREDFVRRHGRNNWPPKPYWPFAPLLYHEIDEEIPAPSRQIVHTLYRLWLVLVLTIILNLVACILLLVTGSSDGAKDLGGSIVDLFIIPLAFLLWYRPVYNAFMKEQAFYYYLYFVFNAFHIAFSIYSLIGIPSTGSAGIINTIASFARGSILSGVFCILATIGWGIESAGCLFMFRFVWKHHNDKGHTFAQAKSEVSTYGLKAYFSRSNHVPSNT